MRVPTRSAGTRSGVSCRRLNEPPSTSATVLTVSVLARAGTPSRATAGDALEQHVAAVQQRNEHALEHRLLADDHPLDLEERVLERVVRGPGGIRLLLAVEGVEPALLWGHLVSPASGSSGSLGACRASLSGYAGRRRAPPSVW